MKKLFTYFVALFGMMSASFLVGGVSQVDAATLNVPGDYGTIQAAINAADPGDEVFVENGTYNENLVINKAITLRGKTRNNTIINPTGSGYGITVNSDDVSLRRFTLQGAQHYGIKVAKCAGCGYLTNLLINNVKVDGSARSHIDLNGVQDSVINNVVVTNTPRGVGIGLQNNVNVTLTNVTSTNNAWGGVGIWTTTNAGYPTAAGSNGIVIENLQYNGVPYGLYTQETNPELVAPTADEFLCTVTSSDTTVRADIENFVFYFKTKAEADAHAAAVNGTTDCPDSTKPTGNFVIPEADEIFTTNSVDVTIEANDNIELKSLVINMKNATGGHLGTCYNNPNISATDHTANCTVDTTAYADGTYELRSGILDHANNRLTISRNFIVDRTKPNVAISTPENGAAVQGTFAVTGTADDATTDISEVLYTVNEISALGGSFVASIANGVTNGTTTWDFNVSGLSDGFYRLRVQAFDLAGNWRYRYHDVQVDNTKPVTSVVSPAADGTFDENFTITINSVDDGSQVKSALANLYGPSGLIGSCANETFDPTEEDVDFTCDVDVDSLADGAYYIKTNTRDVAGNLSNTVTWNFTIERIDPGFCGDGYVDEGEECDDGNTVTEACAYGDENCMVCNGTCQLVVGETSYCGDGVVNGGEQCDDGNTIDGDGCSSTCQIEEGGPEGPITSICPFEDEELCEPCIGEECLLPELCEDGYSFEEGECVPEYEEEEEEEQEEQPEVCLDEVESVENTTVDAVAHSSSTPLVTETTVVAGDQLMIAAEGTWRAGESDEPASRESDADGLDGYDPYNGFKYGALVGRIGGGDWFLVGTSFNQEVTESGSLELVYRDGDNADNSGFVAVAITKTSTEEVACSEECVGEECEDDTPPSMPPTSSGGSASSITVGTLLETGPTRLLSTGPEDDMDNVEDDSDDDMGEIEDLIDTLVEDVEILATPTCDDDSYILERHTKLHQIETDVVFTVPDELSFEVKFEAMRLRAQLMDALNGLTTVEEKNNFIRGLVCSIETKKESRNLKHTNIGYMPGTIVIEDYLLQYHQDIAIYHFTK